MKKVDTDTTRTDKEGLRPCTAVVLVSFKIYFFTWYMYQPFVLFVMLFFRVIRSLVDPTLAALPLAVPCCFEFYFFDEDANSIHKQIFRGVRKLPLIARHFPKCFCKQRLISSINSFSVNALFS